jgi:hypothetical protein
VSITPSLTAPNPGQTLVLTISISQTNGPVAGFFMTDTAGVFSIVDSGTKLLGGGVTHTAPRTGSGGVTQFKVGWTAPAQPGGADFSVWANSANGDNTSRGDGEGDAFFSTAYGCAGIKYYHDYDGDSYGAVASGYTMNCSVPQYYALNVGDCDDNDPTVHPGAPEICDGKDNNCNGQIDEGLPIVSYCTDADGDGHGVLGAATTMGCKPLGASACATPIATRMTQRSIPERRSSAMARTTTATVRSAREPALNAAWDGAPDTPMVAWPRHARPAHRVPKFATISTTTATA